MWKLLATLALAAAGQTGLQDEVSTLAEADAHLMAQVKELRAIVNEQLPKDLQALVRRTEWNRQAIARIAELTQGEMLVLAGKMTALGEDDRKTRAEVVQEGRQMDELARASQIELKKDVRQQVQAASAQQESQLQQVAQWLQHEFNQEDAQLKGLIREAKEEDAELEREVTASRRKVANVSRVVEALPQARLDVQQQLSGLAQKLEAVELSTEDARRREQEQMQVHSNQLIRLQNHLDDMMTRSQSRESRYDHMNQTLAAVAFKQRVSFFVILSSLVLGLLGFLTFWYQQRQTAARGLSLPCSNLAEPLLASRNPSELSFSVVTPGAGRHPTAPECRRFFPKSMVSTAKGCVEAEMLRPKATVLSALGNTLEVGSVAFKHMEECDVVELGAGNSLPSTTVFACHWLLLGPSGQQAARASDVKVGDEIVLYGTSVELTSVQPMTLRLVDVVEVELSPDEPLDVHADACKDPYSFHMV